MHGTSKTDRPRLALTSGDSAGVGPELVLRALHDPTLSELCQLVVYGSAKLLRRVATATGLPFEHGKGLAGSDGTIAYPCGVHTLLDLPFAEVDSIVPGEVQAACGYQAYLWLKAAVRDMQNGQADAIVTAPINKAALNAAGIPFPGHTEMLATLTGGAKPCMAFYAQKLFVTLATIHEPLANVPRLLTVAGLQHVVALTYKACQRLTGNKAPRIGVLALNPHAGENGLFGNEEATIIAPAIDAARQNGLQVAGPLVPDTAFTWLLADKPAPYDGYVAMYHDQGLIPFKMAAFDTGVNVTLGLPIIRTSPDHGTAFDIAWQGRASPASLLSAIRLAARLSRA